MNLIKKYKGIIIILLILIVGYGIFNYYNSKNEVVETPKLTTITKGDVTRTVSATGSLAAIDNVDINSKITGRIVKLYVSENQHVNKGDLLMQLDPTSYDAAKEQAEAKLIDASLTYNRNKKLYEEGAIAKSILDSSKADYIVAKANLKVAKSNLEDTEIRTPIEGYIIGEPTPVGQTVSSGISTPQVLMNVATLDNMEVETLVDESDIGSIKLGQKVNFTVDSYPDDTFTGKVTLISRDAVEENNVIYYTVYVKVDDSKGKLFPTMTASTEFIVETKKDVLRVAESAVKSVKGKNVVYTYDAKDNKEKMVEVTKGLEGDYNVEISGDINEGQEVVASPQSDKNKASSSKKQSVPRSGGMGRPF